MEWHWHNELQLCLVTQGIIVFEVGDYTEILRAGEGIFINASIMHKASNAEGSDGAYICLDFHPLMLLHSHISSIDSKYITPFIADNTLPYCILHPEESWSADIIQSILSINEEYTSALPSELVLGSAINYYQLPFSRDPDQFKIYMELLSIWYQLYRNYFTRRNSMARPSQDETVLHILRYIGEHYSEKIMLNEIARHVGASTASCSRKFKAHMHLSIFEYIMNYRLQQSERLLLTTDLSITEIAVNCGFSTSSYYIKHFRESCGHSPSAYRKAHKADEPEKK